VESEENWFRLILRGLVNAYMVCAAVALYEIFIKYALPDLQFTEGAVHNLNIFWMVFPIVFTIFVELVAYFKILKPITEKPLEKQFVTKNWVNLLFFLSFFYAGLSAGGVVALALLAILWVALEKG